MARAYVALRLHGFGLVALTQFIWFIAAGCLLMRTRVAEAPALSTAGPS